MEELLKNMGFTDEPEFHRMVATVDMSSPSKVKAFKDWQNNDGTKDGLAKLPVKV